MYGENENDCEWEGEEQYEGECLPVNCKFLILF